MFHYSNGPNPPPVNAAMPHRPTTPEENPFSDHLSPEYNGRPASMYSTQAPSTTGSSAAFRQLQLTQRYFQSRRVRKGTIDKPPLTRDPKEKWVTILPLLALTIGLCISGFLVWDGVRSVVNHNYCSVFQDNFSSGELNPDVWTKEVETGGYG
jgi:hypothetical protein